MKHANLLKVPENDSNLVKAHGEQLLQNKLVEKPGINRRKQFICRNSGMESSCHRDE